MRLLPVVNSAFVLLPITEDVTRQDWAPLIKDKRLPVPCNKAFMGVDDVIETVGGMY